MPTSVTYWTHTWDPSKEAISKEIVALRQGGREKAPVVAFSPGHRTRFDHRGRVLLLSSRRWLALRAVGAIVEPLGQVTHIFGGPESWHLFRSLGRRPILLTVVASRLGAVQLPMTNLVRVAVEVESSIDDWIGAGIPRARIEIVRPGVDLEWFAATSAPAASARFTLLFASTPSDPAELDARGIPVLVELARALPDVDIVVPWRAWGDVDAARKALEDLRPPANFVLTFGDVKDMRIQYARAHATIACFEVGAAKSCPNFVVEGLACARPCIATPGVGIAALLERTGAGLIASRDVASLADAVNRLRVAWMVYAERARRLAEEEFDVRHFVARYERLYDEVAAR
ncbi:MAG: glycosyltransferase [Vicinamibacterales bacterium]